MLASAVALGVTAGSLNAPTGTAAREPAVLGFVPQPGWFALQSPPPAVPGQQTVAVAANVPFAADDVDNGLVEPSGLPYSTLLSLPERRDRDREHDDAGHGTASGADPDQRRSTRTSSCRSGSATAFRFFSRARRCVRSSRSRSTSCEDTSVGTTSTSSRTSGRLDRRTRSSGDAQRQLNGFVVRSEAG